MSFGLLEFIGAALACLSVYLIFYHPSIVFNLLRNFDDNLLAKVITVGIFLLPGTIFFGAGLPILASEKRIPIELDRLYAANTLGGAFGCLLFGIFVPFYTTFFVSSLLALTLTSSVFVYAYKKEKRLQQNIIKRTGIYKSLNQKALLLACLSGFFFICLEIISERILGLLLGDRSYIGAIILTLILIIISLGALSVRIIKDHTKLFSISVILGFISLFIIYFLKDSALFVDQSHQYLSKQKVSFILFGLIPLLYSMSLIFPTCLSWIKDKNPTAETGFYLGVNTISALFASLATSHFLFSSIGLNGILSLTGFSLIIIGLLTLPKMKKSFVILGLPIIFLFTQTKLSITSPNKLIVQEENAETHFSIITRNGKEEIYGGNDRLIAPWKRKNMAHAQEALAFFPALYTKNNEQLLMVGLGYGITAGAFTKLEAKEVEVLEILPQLIKYTHRYKELNRSWQKNDKVNLIVNDGLHHLSLSNKKYDIISVSIDNPYTAAASYALTKEFYKIVTKRLSQGGVFSQMIWGPHLPEIITTLNTVFPYIKILPAYSESDFIVIGSLTPLELKASRTELKKYWTPFLEGTQPISLEENILRGEKILKELKSSPSEFIISKHSPKMEYDQKEGLGLMWIRK